MPNAAVRMRHATSSRARRSSLRKTNHAHWLCLWMSWIP
jgi:hypothetical protein